MYWSDSVTNPNVICSQYLFSTFYGWGHPYKRYSGYYHLTVSPVSPFWPLGP